MGPCLTDLWVRSVGLVGPMVGVQVVGLVGPSGGLVGPSGRTCVSKLLDLWVQIVAFLIGLVGPCLDGLVGPVVLMPNVVLVDSMCVLNDCWTWGFIPL